jgi:hypothetical protein
MYSIRSIILAQSMIQDRQSSAMSAINIIEQFFPPGYPILIPSFVVFAIIERAEGALATPKARVDILLGNERLFGQEVDINFADAILNRLSLEFQGFMIPRPGRLRISLRVGDAHAESYAIDAFPVGTPLPKRLT